MQQLSSWLFQISRDRRDQNWGQCTARLITAVLSAAYSSESDLGLRSGAARPGGVCPPPAPAPDYRVP